MKRNASDPIFGNVVPEQSALDFIENQESGPWRLVVTRSANDPSSLELHRDLAACCEVLHYMHNASENGTVVGISLYFVRPRNASGGAK